MINPKQIACASIGVIVSFLLGYGTASKYPSDINTKLGIGASSAMFGGGLVWFCYNRKLKQLTTHYEKRLESFKSKIENLDKEKLDDRFKYNELLAELNKNRELAQIQLTERQNLLDTIRQELTNTKQFNQSQSDELSKLKVELTTLKQNLEVSRNEIKRLEGVINFKENELKHFEETFNQSLEEEFNKRVKKVVDETTREQFQLLEDTFAALDRMDSFLKKIYYYHEQQEQTVLGYSDQFIQFKDRLIAKHDAALDSQMELNEELHTKVAILESKLVNGIIEPIKQEYPLGDEEGRFINKFIDLVWSNFEIPLKGLGFKTIDENTHFACNYPLTVGGNNVASRINSNIKYLQSTLGLYSLKIEYDKVHDCIAVSYRKNPPKPESDDDIYKAGLIPASQFCDSIFKATDHITQGKPTLRIMASTGEGKGIVAKNLVAYFAALEDWEIWVSDPLHGSEQDYWDCPKIATDNKQTKQAYKLFTQLHSTRKDDKVDGFTDRYVLGIFDEFDKQHSDDDKLTAKNIMTAIRHTKQRQILIGQCAEVGANGWSWDDMKNCSLLVLGDSIGTLCKHLSKDLGWTLKKTNEVKRLYEKFSDWAIKKNESNPDIPNENAYRIGLLVVGSRYQFLELPNAHKGIIRSPQVRKSFDDTAPCQLEIVDTLPHCPNCGSTNVKPYGKDGRWQCLNNCGQKTFRPKK